MKQQLNVLYSPFSRRQRRLTLYGLLLALSLALLTVSGYTWSQSAHADGLGSISLQVVNPKGSKICFTYSGENIKNDDQDQPTLLYTNELRDCPKNKD